MLWLCVACLAIGDADIFLTLLLYSLRNCVLYYAQKLRASTERAASSTSYIGVRRGNLRQHWMRYEAGARVSSCVDLENTMSRASALLIEDGSVCVFFPRRYILYARRRSRYILYTHAPAVCMGAERTHVSRRATWFRLLRSCCSQVPRIGRR